MSTTDNITWSTSYEASTAAAPAAVWAALRALHSGQPLGPASDSFVLHGPFALGTEVSVTPLGGETMRSVITELVDDAVYADRTVFGGLELTFRHVLTRTAEGTDVRHELEIGGDDAAVMAPELGPQISADFPVAMAELLAAAERGVA